MKWVLPTWLLMVLFAGDIGGQNEVSQQQYNPIEAQLTDFEVIIPSNSLNQMNFKWLEEELATVNTRHFDDLPWFSISNKFKLGFRKEQEEQGVLKIFNGSGERILSDALAVKKGINRYPIDASEWSSGVYVIFLQLKEHYVIKKVYKP